MATGNAGFIKFTTAGVRRRRKPNDKGRDASRVSPEPKASREAVATGVPLLLGGGVWYNIASKGETSDEHYDRFSAGDGS